MHTLTATIKRLVRRARALLRPVQPWPLRGLIELVLVAAAVAALVEYWLPISILVGSTILAGALVGRAKLPGTILVAAIAGAGWLILPEVPELAVAAGALVGIFEQRQVAFQRPGGGGQPLGAPQPVAKAPIWARVGRTK